MEIDQPEEEGRPLTARERTRADLRKAPVNWYTAREQIRTLDKRFLAPADNTAMHNLAVRHGDDLDTDQLLILTPIIKPEEALPYVETLYAISPHSPTARARLILANAEPAKRHAEAWKKECQHAILSVAFAKKAFLDKNPGSAEPRLDCRGRLNRATRFEPLGIGKRTGVAKRTLVGVGFLAGDLSRGLVRGTAPVLD